MTPNRPIVHVVDDDAQFRAALSRLLTASGYQVALYDSAERLLEAPLSTQGGCILLDVRMPGLSGPELQARLAEMGHPLPIIFLTGHAEVRTGVQAIKTGADDYLLKPVSRNVLIEAIRCALARYERTRELALRVESAQARAARFTPREREVFALVVRGKLNKQIAYELGTTERTVKAHRHSAMRKLQVQSVAEAVLIAEQIGLLAPINVPGGSP